MTEGLTFRSSPGKFDPLLTEEILITAAFKDSYFNLHVKVEYKPPRRPSRPDSPSDNTPHVSQASVFFTVMIFYRTK